MGTNDKRNGDNSETYTNYYENQIDINYVGQEENGGKM